MPQNNPTRWSDDELRKDRDLSEARFVLERQGEGPTAFYKAWDIVRPQIEHAMLMTDNLRDIRAQALLAERGLWQTLRYFCAPPVSEEDLWTLVGKKFKNVPNSHAEKTAQAFASVLDARRAPWVAQGRPPTAEEAELAVFSTSVLLTYESFKTGRRGTSSRAQEEEVSEALKAAGLAFDPARSPINDLDGLSRATFSRERKVAGAKCDLPIRLKDGRLLALECKVSNGPKNSWKRLQREVGGKADTWRREFGSRVITGALLAGVFDLTCVRRSQEEQGVAIFWQHDLAPLLGFVTD
ncbi:MAG: XamI family restriction endonuclease [Sphingomonas sp.]|nr:XamI family restriction endonuclease [Sphingomonas sp.]